MPNSFEEDALDAWSMRLLEHGFCVVEDAIDSGAIAALDTELEADFRETPFCSGGFYGETTKRFGRLLARAQRSRDLVQHPLMLGLAERVLGPWCDCFQLNVTQAIAIHPGAPQQVPHRDQDMWSAPKGTAEYLINVLWPLTPFTTENGATIVWPGSHGAQALEPEPRSKPIAAVMRPGDALVFLGSTLHGAGPNRSDAVRRGIVIGYSLGWLKPYENQHLAYPPSVARTFPPELAALVGYRQHRPNLGNFEGRCPSLLLDGVTGPLGAHDALRPDQRALVDAWLVDQRAAR